jgi:hypothetical protein
MGVVGVAGNMRRAREVAALAIQRGRGAAQPLE